MTENLDSAVNSLSEHTRKLEIATHYTYGDMEKAKQMIAGTYKDIFAIKGRFSSSSLYGAFMLFFNVPYTMINSIYLILSHSFTVNDLKTNTDWKIFEKGIAQLKADGEADDVLGNQLKDEIMSGFTVQFSADLKKLFDMDDEIAVNRTFQKFIQDRMGLQNVDMSIDYEQITSVDMEMNSSSSTKISAIEAEKRKEEEEKKNRATIELDSENPLAGRDVKLVLQGHVILSPIKGKDIGNVKTGDRIRISLADKNPKAIQVAKAFNAYKEDGTIRPIPGRVVYIKHNQPAGYKIYAIVAKGIYIKIDEDEDNIKIAIESPNAVAEKEDTSSMSRIFIIIVVIIFAVAGIAFLISKLI